MKITRFLDLYDRVANAPDAVARLRRFVLDLAVRGKLVPQDSGDESASQLLKRIARGPCSRRATNEAPSEPPFCLPQGWTWIKLGALVIHSDAGWSPKTENHPRQDDTWGVLKVSAVSWGRFDASENKQVLPGTQPRLQAQIHRGDFLISRANTSELVARAVNVDDEPINLMMSDKIVRLVLVDLCQHDFVLIVNNYAEYARSYYAANATGASPSMKNVSRDVILNLPFPLPPLAEQRRIVAKVDELMALCDRLEEARTRREAHRARLTTASLSRLTAPETDAQTFQSHARFALDALPALTTRPDQIKALRQTILNLAVRGKLVEQDPAGESASGLLARMVQERKAIVESRKIRGATPPKPPSKNEGFDLPTSWRLCALGQITLITDPNPSHRYPDYSGGTVPILSTREFDGDDGWNPGTAKLTTRAFWKFQKEICDFAEGDIIFARKGRLGLPRFLPPFEQFTFSHTLFCIKPMTGLCPAYLLWLLRRDEVVAWLTSEMNQNTGVPTLGKAKFERLPIPLPPLAEQHRIVAKVHQLMALCDRLETSLAIADTTRRRLLEALLHEALEPADNTLAAAQ